jgi:hypothetical protein
MWNRKAYNRIEKRTKQTGLPDWAALFLSKKTISEKTTLNILDFGGRLFVHQ